MVPGANLHTLESENLSNVLSFSHSPYRISWCNSGRKSLDSESNSSLFSLWLPFLLPFLARSSRALEMGWFMPPPCLAASFPLSVPTEVWKIPHVFLFFTYTRGYSGENFLKGLTTTTTKKHMAECSSSRPPPHPIRKACQWCFPDKNCRTYMEESIAVVVTIRYPGVRRYGYWG